ncbi:hypothetical protein C491_07311 [Natronococcus amylolyticus DSM 10524]|uniref:DUF7344 domain-containing protein n=1 Tax=Natronococcus amylolyticus DSM 10524 TaxID=1227497 RepID=L9XBM0_9EURY|nr:hypothetical protein [Natronococcus amylolyticus]ELY59130.1 hypothetical protein C491_07311 [Natronococcus amylolyticus DSM 10524]
MKDRLEDLSALADAVSEHDVDELLGLLSAREVRITLAYLYDHPNATVDELAAAITGAAAAESGRIGGESEYERAHVYLHHSVLPRLQDHGLIEFDPVDGTVEEVDVPPAVYDFLGVGE